jgi:hypothetical protein
LPPDGVEVFGEIVSGDEGRDVGLEAPDAVVGDDLEARDKPPIMRLIRRRARTRIGSKPIKWNFASINIKSSPNERVCNPLQDSDIASGRMMATTVSSKRVTVSRSMRLIESPHPVWSKN